MNKLAPQNKQQEHLVQILLAKLQELPVEFRVKGLSGFEDWRISETNRYLSFGGNIEYRIKQKEPLKLYAENCWNLLDPEWKYIAQDANGEICKYTHKPIPDKLKGYWVISRGNVIPIKGLGIYNTGYKWYETLITRPQGV